LRFGFLNRTVTQKESIQLCKSSNFENLITVRSRKEAIELETAIEDYEQERTGIRKASIFLKSHFNLESTEFTVHSVRNQTKPNVSLYSP